MSRGYSELFWIVVTDASSCFTIKPILLAGCRVLGCCRMDIGSGGGWETVFATVISGIKS